ncbi:MAG: peptidyl-prolyl cis-trans isomerase [Nitrospirota bacterium]|nr:MAG: peptidyl-prolyl cis-trans isomerase [Nitrospirota bacterium]
MFNQLICEASSKYTPRLLGWLFLLNLVLLPTSGLGFTDRIVAVVNKEVITWFDLQNKIQDEHSRLKAKYRGEELERRYTQKQREVLNALIIERLQLQEAKAKGISITQEEIDAALRRTPLPATQTEEEFGQHLLLKKLFDFEVRRNVVVEEEELRRYYEANTNKFRTPPQYRLKQIFLKAQNEIARLPAKSKAQVIYSDWTSEIPIEDLAARHMQIVSELGWVEEKDLVTPLAQVLKELTPGTLSRPIDTQAGVHLLMIEEVKESQPLPFKQVERKIHAQLLKQRSEEAYNEWVNKLEQQAFIDVKL